MKTAPLPLIALLAAASVFAAVARASDSEIEIGSHSFAAIAYSPVTGKYGYAYNHRSRWAAEKVALAQCGAEDARIACWVNRGFCALALGDDKTCWESAGSTAAGRATTMQKNSTG